MNLCRSCCAVQTGPMSLRLVAVIPYSHRFILLPARYYTRSALLPLLVCYATATASVLRSATASRTTSVAVTSHHQHQFNCFSSLSSMGCGQSSSAQSVEPTPAAVDTNEKKAESTTATTEEQPTEKKVLTSETTPEKSSAAPASTESTATESVATASSTSAEGAPAIVVSEAAPVATSETSAPTTSASSVEGSVATSTLPVPESQDQLPVSRQSTHLKRDLDEAAQLELKLRETPAAAPAPSTTSTTNSAAEMSSSSAAASTAAEPAWKSFTPEQLAAIETARSEVRAKGPLVMDPKGTYGLICRACQKPNSVNVTFCTGCSFPSVTEDIQRLPDNIFLELVKGVDIGATVRSRDDSVIVFDDKYPVSENHLDVIPTEVYADVTVLNASHVPMLERLYELGRAEFLRRNIPWLPADVNIDDLITAGYNYPVSVKHLHLHMVLPPFRHEKVFQYPRWHSHRKVVADLKTHGKVLLYSETPNDAEGEEEYQRAMKNSEKAKGMQQQYAQAQGTSAEAGTEAKKE